VSFLVDVEGCDHGAVDDLIKASAETGAAGDMWRVLENPWARALVETITQRTQMDPDMLAAMRDYLSRLDPDRLTSKTTNPSWNTCWRATCRQASPCLKPNSSPCARR
jgi:hypothetical protein